MILVYTSLTANPDQSLEMVSAHPQGKTIIIDEDYHEAQTIFLYCGKERILKHNFLCLPCEEFLNSLHPNVPLAEKNYGV